MTIMDDSSTANGSAMGRMVQAPHIMNSMITPNERPLPTSSSMYSHRNCIIRMKTTMSNIATKGPINAFSVNLSSFLILSALI